MRLVRQQVIARRSEPALNVIGRLAPALSLLPDEALREVKFSAAPAAGAVGDTRPGAATDVAG
jgi:hypothetical protein